MKQNRLYNILESEDLYDDTVVVVYNCFVIPFLPTLFHVFLVFSPVLPLKKVKKVFSLF